MEFHVLPMSCNNENKSRDFQVCFLSDAVQTRAREVMSREMLFLESSATFILDFGDLFLCSDLSDSEVVGQVQATDLEDERPLDPTGTSKNKESILLSVFLSIFIHEHHVQVLAAQQPQAVCESNRICLCACTMQSKSNWTWTACAVNIHHMDRAEKRGCCQFVCLHYWTSAILPWKKDLSALDKVGTRGSLRHQAFVIKTVTV